MNDTVLLSLMALHASDFVAEMQRQLGDSELGDARYALLTKGCVSKEEFLGLLRGTLPPDELALLEKEDEESFREKVLDAIGERRFSLMTKGALCKAEFLEYLEEHKKGASHSLPKPTHHSNGKSASSRDPIDYDDDDTPF